MRLGAPCSPSCIGCFFLLVLVIFTLVTQKNYQGMLLGTFFSSLSVLVFFEFFCLQGRKFLAALAEFSTDIREDRIFYNAGFKPYEITRRYPIQKYCSTGSSATDI